VKNNIYYIKFSFHNDHHKTLTRWKKSLEKSLSEKYNWIELKVDSENLLLDDNWPFWKDHNSFIIFSSIYPYLNGYVSDWKKVTEITHRFLCLNKKYFFDYKGKILYVNDLDDGIRGSWPWPKDFIDRIDAFLALSASWEVRDDIPELYRKIIFLPKYIRLYNKFYQKPNKAKKNKKIFFYGSYDPFRAKIIDEIKNSTLAKYFEGGITKLNNSVTTKDKNSTVFGSDEYMKKNKKIFVDRISQDDYFKGINESLISLCPGQWWNTISYRHIESIMVGSAIISSKLEKLPDQIFLYKDQLEKVIYFFNEDLSDFLETCSYCLDNEKEILEAGENGRFIYNNYWELQSDYSYRNNVWGDIKNQFLNLNIEI